MIALTLELGRINKARIFVGKNGKKYLSFILVEAPDVYGNAGTVVPLDQQRKPCRRSERRNRRQLEAHRRE
jgi:hypothetical protein